jgi:hypothetical protein
VKISSRSKLMLKPSVARPTSIGSGAKAVVLAGLSAKRV